MVLGGFRSFHVLVLTAFKTLMTFIVVTIRVALTRHLRNEKDGK